jgi:hypothetical protein
MIGARQLAGSTIVNGGDNSPSNWVIRRAPSLSSTILLSDSFLPENRVFCEAILSEIASSLPSEKSPFTLERFFVRHETHLDCLPPRS